MKPEHREPPLVMIDWVDSCGHTRGPWHAREDVEALVPTVIRSTGWLICETPGHLTIVSHISDSGQVSGEMCIPRRVIKRRWTMSEPKRRT